MCKMHSMFHLLGFAHPSGPVVETRVCDVEVNSGEGFTACASCDISVRGRHGLNKSGSYGVSRDGPNREAAIDAAKKAAVKSARELILWDSGINLD